MNKANRIAAYRCALIEGYMLRGVGFDVQRIETAAVAMLRAETASVALECDVGSCTNPAFVGYDLCKEHGKDRS